MRRHMLLGLVAALIASAALAQVREGKNAIRVVVVSIDRGEKAVVARLRDLGFDVAVVSLERLNPDRLRDGVVLCLPSCWASHESSRQFLDEHKVEIQRFIARGGGLLMCQPNPLAPGWCTPALLPYPITFQNHYDKDKERINVDPSHFITDDLPGSDMPFPADPMVKVDGRYTILAKQKRTGWPSLAVCRFGDGRVVVQTANESRAATVRLPDEILRRMVVWAAGREPVR